MKLIIFDLDQTLVDFLDIHNLTTKALFKEYFGLEANLTEIDFAGRSLLDNLAALAKLKGVPETLFNQKSQTILQSYETIFAEMLPEDGSKHILPGVQRLLDALSEGDYMLALYTGDSPGIVKSVLALTKLDNYFKLVVTSNEAENRVGMARLAVERAMKLSGSTFRNSDVVIIGDSIHDIDCGKQLNALTIAVATGYHSKSRLLQSKPDFLFQDLRDCQRVLKAIDTSRKKELMTR